jgi:outer membrane usher protein
VAFFAVLPASAADPRVESTTGGGRSRELLVEIAVNGEPVASALIVVRADARISMSEAEFGKLRFKPPPSAAITTRDGERFVSLDQVPLIKYTLDERLLTLSITAPAEAFEASEFQASGTAAPKLSPTAPGGFLNYDVSAEHAGGQTLTGGVFEAGVFGRYGVGLVSALVRNDADQHEFVRLDTTWTKDFPDRLASLRIGDSISLAGAWGRSVRFGGVQFATNFATQPYFVRFPLQAVVGEAAMPSTVDLVVNGVPTATQRVPAGPFRIDDVPTITGSGDIKIIVRDVLGREQVTVVPYYTPLALLRAGLSDYALELGKVRKNFGLQSNDYGRTVGSASYRRGITNAFTAEVRGEFAGAGDGNDRLGSAGVAGAYLLGDIGVVNAAFAGSTSNQGSGALYSLGFARQARIVTFGVQTIWTTRDFRQIGLQSGQPAPRNITLASIGVNTGRTGTVSFGYGTRDDRIEPRRQTYTLSYSLSLGRWGSIYATATDTRGNGNASRAVFLNYTVPIGQLTSASVSWNRTLGSSDSELVGTLQKSPPLGEGWGYLLQGTDSGRAYANAVGKSRYGDAFAEVRYGSGETAYRVGAAGALVALGRSVNATRPVTQSFAVVDVPSFPNVRVYQDNQLVGRTSDDGTILLPTLRPYERNPVRIDQRDLPLTARVDALEVEAVPQFKSGVLVTFPVGREFGAVLRVQRANGKPPPAGAVASIVGKDGVLPVAPDGELYVTGLTEAARVIVKWPDGACELDIERVAGDDPLPDLGTRICRERAQ